MSPRRRVTIKDVASATDLSPAAVSYALRGVQTSPETQERVRAAAEQLGYTGNAVARALSQGRTGLVGVLAGSLEDLGEQRFVQSVGQALEANALHMVLTDSAGDPERERALARQLADQMVDALVVSPLDPSNAAWAAIGETLPVVSVGDALAGPTVGDVIFDNRAGVFMVLEHLHALGHRHVAVLTPSRPETPARPAETMVREAAAALALDVITVNSRHSIEAATEAARALLSARAPAHRGVLPVGFDRLWCVRRCSRARDLAAAGPQRGRLRRPSDRAGRLPHPDLGDLGNDRRG